MVAGASTTKHQSSTESTGGGGWEYGPVAEKNVSKKKATPPQKDGH